MSLLWMDNFDSYGTDETKLLDGLYAQTGDAVLSTDPDGVSTGKVMYFQTSSSTLRRVLPSAIATVGTGGRFWFDGLPTSGIAEILAFSDENNVTHITLGVLTTGVITAYRGSSGGTSLGSTSVPVLASGAWNHIEAKVLISDTVGTVEVRVNGVVVLNLTGQDTRNGGVASVGQIRWCSSTASQGFQRDFYLKDITAWSTSGSYNNDFMGDVQVVTLRPASDVSFNWTASTGSTGWDLIDESTPSDTDYISADATPPAASTFSLTDVDSDVTSIKGVMMVGRMLKTDGGDAQVQMSMVSGVSTADGSDRAITTAATYWFDINETDPATSLPWDRVALNAANIKVNRTL